MNIYDMLTYGDRELILNYIDEYAYMDDDDNRTASLDHLLRFWAKNKENLFHLFGDKFILERDITFRMSADEICRIMDKDYSNERSAYYTFRMAMREIRAAGSDVPLRTDYSTNRWLLNRIVENTYALAQNAYLDERFTFPLPDGKNVIFDRGCKPMRLLGKIAKAYGLETQFEEFRLWHSQKLNQKALSGTVCLSIHPLDFMTMSDNDCDWGSCMSWQDQGCYRSGTVECMNSEYVVVAYLKAKDDMDVPGGTWNNKKWRSLFLVSDNVVTSIKGYPYQHEELNKAVLNWFKEFLPGNYSEPMDYQYCGHGIALAGDYDERDYPTPRWNVEFYTSGHMYNDFGTVHHTGMFVEENMIPYQSSYNRDNCIMIDYSGPAVCMACGGVGDMPSDETELCCVACSFECFCESCESHLRRGEGYELDGRTLCEDCYYEYRTYDPFTGEAHYEPDMNQLYFVPVECKDDLKLLAEKGRWSSAFSSLRVWSEGLFWGIDDVTKDKDYGKYFTCQKIPTMQRWWSTYHYITFEDLTDEGRKVIEHWLEEEVCEDYEEYMENARAYIRRLDA